VYVYFIGHLGLMAVVGLRYSNFVCLTCTRTCIIVQSTSFTFCK